MTNILSMARFVGLSLLSRNMTVSPLKLQKILYYIQSWHMVYYGREKTVFADVPQAWVNGPVYPAVYHEYKNCVSNMCDHLDKSHFGVPTDMSTIDAFRNLSQSLDFSSDEAEFMESVIMLYGSKPQNYLIFLTHAEQPWAEKREGLAPYERSEVEMSLDTMYSYYKKRHDNIMQRHENQQL